MNRIKREREIKRLALKPAPSVSKDPDFTDGQFSLPDESIRFMVYIGRCYCGGHPELRRVWDSSKLKYRVACPNVDCAGPFDTPWLKNSQDAIQCWELAVRLSRS